MDFLISISSVDFVLFFFPGLEVLCIVLNRFAYPSRYVDMEQVFSRSGSEICRFFNLGLQLIFTNFGDRIMSLDQPWLKRPHLESFCRAIHDRGAPLDNCFGFIDGSVRPVCRAEGQTAVYCGERVDALKFQSVVTPNGLIVNLYGPMPGGKHDTALLQDSCVLNYMATTPDFTRDDGTPLVLYGDLALPPNQHLGRPHCPINRKLPASLRQFNDEMSGVRTAVEWEFGTVLEEFAFLDFQKSLNVFQSPIGTMYIVGCILTNCLLCFKGYNKTSSYFGLQPPTIQEYLY